MWVLLQIKLTFSALPKEYLNFSLQGGGHTLRTVGTQNIIISKGKGGIGRS